MAQGEKRPRGRPASAKPVYPETFIKAWRERSGLTQAQLEAKTGRDRTTLSKLENAQRGHALHAIHDISVALNVPPAVLLYVNPRGDSEIAPWRIGLRSVELSATQRKLLLGIIELMVREQTDAG
jgi:transcriptional regulator with XRE-family HTH domain